MKTIFEYCEKGDAKYNEDVIKANQYMACVIDGATDVFRDEHENMDGIVHDYVNELIQCIFLYYDEADSLHIIIKKAIDRAYSYFDDIYCLEKYREYELPTFSIACIKKCMGGFEYLTLGDCSIAYINKGRIEIIKDERVKEFAKYNRNEMKRLKIDPRNDYDAIEIYRNTRMKANCNEGYPIGSIRGVGLMNAICGFIDKDSVDSILLYSDGFEDYFDGCNIDISVLFDKKNVQEIIEASKEFFYDDEQYLKQLRPKQVDDRSIMLINVSE